MNNKIIVLRGIGGNLKTSLLNRFIYKEFIPIPECNREFERDLRSKFNRGSDFELNYCVKKLVMKSILSTVNNEKIIMDRSLIDYALLNDFTKDILEWYYHIHSDKIKISDAFYEEKELFDGNQIYNVLLITSDDRFIEHMLNQEDERAYFYDNIDWYYECQDRYKNFVMNNYHHVIPIILQDVPFWSYAQMNSYINATFTRIWKKINLLS